MTNEKAIKMLEYIRRTGNGESEYKNDAQAIAIDMAIKALEQTPKTWGLDDAREDFMNDVYNALDFLPTNNEANRIIDSFDRVTSGLEQQTCEDCISRQAVLEGIAEWVAGGYADSEADISHISSLVTHLPSVTPKERTGKWIDEADREYAHFGQHIYKCSECGKHAEYFVGGSEHWWDIEKPNYCPNCGARMVDE